MGSEQSSHANGTVKTKEPVEARGLIEFEVKSMSTESDNSYQTDVMADDVEFDEDDDDDDSLDTKSQDEQEPYSNLDEERSAILADCQKLMLMAQFFSHPEIPVKTTDHLAMARCYFDRASAPEVESFDDAETHAQIVADMAALKKLAIDYLHPELPVTVTDSTATARCYFNRASAPEVESVEDAETRAQILTDAVNLKRLAVDYMHPELPVKTTDSTATARCYFERASASEVESIKDTQTRAQILADAAALKKLAVDYIHPELPVKTTDCTATARCYFDRATAPEVESADEAETRAQILADAMTLKKLAVDYMHPELPVKTTDYSAMARCYFDRVSSPKAESVDDAEARAQILIDAAALKKLAIDYMHPELPVRTTDSTATARCYFDRASAPEVESVEEAETRTQILTDAVNLKRLAADYMHPELLLKMSDATATARCYFDRASAPEVESVDDAEARAQILDDAMNLKKLVIDYMHPELPVRTTDSTATACCYFDRASAPEVESVDDDETRAQIFADIAALQKLAIDYMHPELPVKTTDFTATARCYFHRASTPEVESVEDAETRAQILTDVVNLKKAAIDYLHPELPVKTTDSTATARCYFTRASAPEVESVEDAETRGQILTDAAALKKLAVDYLHPELSVKTTDYTATARCYFNRASATEVESFDDAETRAQILADAMNLKKLAVDYMHPELPVKTTDSAATALCYFDRASAPEVESFEDSEARAQILADAAALKKLAKVYMHPELPVAVNDPTVMARCYFNRPSADVLSFERHVTAVSTAEARARSDTEQFDFDDDVFHDVKASLKKFSRAHSFGLEEESRILDKQEEGNLSRSPSSVMLFDMGERSY
jgi:hypothetical protein